MSAQLSLSDFVPLWRPDKFGRNLGIEVHICIYKPCFRAWTAVEVLEEIPLNKYFLIKSTYVGIQKSLFINHLIHKGALIDIVSPTKGVWFFSSLENCPVVTPKTIPIYPFSFPDTSSIQKQ